MSNNPFANLSNDGLEEAKDTLGGFSSLDSDVYEGVIKIAFAGQSAKGAHSVTFHVDLNGREYRETLYVTNRDGQNWYHPKVKGVPDTTKKNPLPGFTTANDIALLASGFGLADLAVEERVIKLWDKDANAEVNTKVNAFVDLSGKPIKLAILKQIVDKNVDDGQGNYVPSGETREENVIDKAFHAETGRTVTEVKSGQVQTGEFIQKWLDKNKGEVRDRSTKEANGAKTGRPGAAGGTAPKSMFG